MLIDLIISAIEWIDNLIHRIIQGVINFLHHVVDWFKSLRLNKNKHIPFIAYPEKFKRALKEAPVKNVGLFEGVYNNDTDEIEVSQWIEADGLDQETKQTLGKEKLVILN